MGHKSKAQKEVEEIISKNVEQEELRNVADLVNETCDRFEELTPRQTVENLHNAAFILNHLLNVDEPKPDTDIHKAPMEVAELLDLAEAVYNWMKSLTSKDGQWVVDSHEFLPANVTYNHVGKMTLIHGISNAIEKYLKNRLVISKKNMSPYKRGVKCIGIYLLEP